MKIVEVFDTTLRDGEQSPGAAMEPGVRLQIASLLEAAGIDTIEAGFPAASDIIARSVAQIARTISSARVAALARCIPSDIDCAVEALRRASHPRLHLFLATSDLHLERKLGISRSQALELISGSIRYARRFISDIEFSAEDATRSDKTFLAEAFSHAIEAGASTINVPDTVGYALPHEIESLFAYIRQRVKGIETVGLSIHTHDDLGMATANALAAVLAGATQVECTVNGIGERAGNCALEELVCAMRTRHDALKCATRFDTRSIQRLSKVVARATAMPIQKNKAIVGRNAFSHESGIHQDGMLKDRSTYEILDPRSVGRTTKIPLGRHSGRRALFTRVEELGFVVSTGEREQLERLFKTLAQTRRVVRDSDVRRLAVEAGCRPDRSPQA